MKHISLTRTGHVLFPLIAAVAISACSDSSDSSGTHGLSVTSYNVGLAPNFVPYALERVAANEALLADFSTDVICLQEVWQAEHIAALGSALEANYPHTYSVPAQQVYTGSAACTEEELDDFANCARTQCPGLSGNALVECGTGQCGVFIPQLSPSCFDGVVATVGLPGITVDSLVDAVTQPVGKFAYDGALGLMLASRYPLENRHFQDFVEDSSAIHRGALYADIQVNGRHHLVGCTHTTANLSGSIPYPESGKFGSWEAENFFMQQQLIGFANNKAGGRPIFFAGDFNCSIANPANGVDAEFPDSCKAWLDDGFADPVAEQLPCSFCAEENTLRKMQGSSGDTLLDHVFVKNVADNAMMTAERVLDDQVSIEALDPVSELAPEESPAMSHPSDHFGVEVRVRLN